jgi:uncharacterized protein YcbK (DUF882 family)
MERSKNFKSDEFKCKCGCGVDGVKQVVVDKLQEIRDKVGFPLKITSGYRCPKHNLAIGGAKGSKHMTGQAVDIWIKDLSPSQKFALVGHSFCEFQGVGIGETILHVDIRDVATLWIYTDK